MRDILYRLKAPLLASFVLLVLFGVIGSLSRFRFSHSINFIFKSGIGAEYQSWFEHFLSGFASPSLLLIFVVLFWALYSMENEGNTKIRIFLIIRTWLEAQSELPLYIPLLAFCALAYVEISFYWELKQFFENGSFQFGQFGCDIVGSSLWFLLLTCCPALRSSGTAQKTQ